MVKKPHLKSTSYSSETPFWTKPKAERVGPSDEEQKVDGGRAWFKHGSASDKDVYYRWDNIYVSREAN